MSFLSVIAISRDMAEITLVRERSVGVHFVTFSMLGIGEFVSRWPERLNWAPFNRAAVCPERTRTVGLSKEVG